MNLNRFSSLTLGKMNTVVALTGVAMTPSQLPQYTTYRVRVAKGETFNPIAITTMLQTFGGLLVQQRVQIRLSLEATHDEICWTITILGALHDVTPKQLLSYI